MPSSEQSRLGINFPFELREERADRARLQLGVLAGEQKADPTLASNQSHQNEIQRATTRAGSPAPAPAPTPTWDEVKAMPEMKTLSGDQIEQARTQYFLDVVAPQVPTDQLLEARAAFDEDTAPGPLHTAARALAKTVETVGGIDSAANAVRKGIGWIDEKLKEPEQPQGPETKPYDRPFMERVQGYMKQGMDSAAADARVRRDIEAGKDDSQPVSVETGSRSKLGTEVKRGFMGLRNSLDGMMLSDLGSAVEFIRKKAKEQGVPPEQVTEVQGLPVDYNSAVKSYQALRDKMEQRSREMSLLPQSSAVRKMFEGEGAEGVDNFINAFKEDPGGAVSTIVGGSVPASLAILATAAMTRLGGFNMPVTAAAGGAASTSVELGNKYKENRDKGMGHKEAWNRAAIHSGAIGAFDAVSLASAGRALGELTKANAVKVWLKESGKQAALGAGGETFGAALSGEMPQPGEVAAEAIGEFVLGVPEGIATISRPGPKSDEVPPAETDPVPAEDVLGKPEQPRRPRKRAEGAVATDAGVGDLFTDPDQPVAPAAPGATPAAAAEAPKPPEIARGVRTRFATERGAQLEGDFAVVDAEALVASHDTALNVNKAYPAELQPRDRTRDASEVQIARIAQNLQPEFLGGSPQASQGAPIIGEDGVVESGNARSIALKRAYGEGKAESYRDWVLANAEKFGIDPAELSRVKRPVLVRVRTTPVNRAEFARQANESSVAAFSPLEQARADATRLKSLEDLQVGENGEIQTGANMGFIRRFVGLLPVTEQAGLVTGTGELSQAGVTRMRNAVLAKAYGGGDVLMRMVESPDDNIRNITAGLVRAAPRVAKAREEIAAGQLHDLDITEDLLKAVEWLSRLRADRKSVDQWMAQISFFEEDASAEFKALMRFLDESSRSPRWIAEFIELYLASVDAAGSPAQESMFGDAVPTKSSIIEQAKKGLSREPEQQQLTAVPAGEGTASAAAPGGPQGDRASGGAAVPRPDESEAQAGPEPARAERREERPAAPVPEPVAPARTAEQAKRGIAPQAPKRSDAELERVGAEAFAAGAKRMVPRDILVKEGVKGGTAWERGWDRANLAAPVPEPKKPARDSSKARAASEDLAAQLSEHFTPGNIVFNAYWNAHDRVISFRPEGEPSGWSVTVERVEKRDGKWVAIEQPRTHSTRPDTRPRGYKVVERAEPEKKPAIAATEKAFGADNKIFTKERAVAARNALRKKLGQVSSGLDPEMVQAGIELAGYYIEGGARKFADYSAKMIADLGEAARPYLKSWYLAVRNYPGFKNDGMESEAQIEATPVAKPIDINALKAYAAKVVENNPVLSVYLIGSTAEGKEAPSDVDLLYVLRPTIDTAEQLEQLVEDQIPDIDLGGEYDTFVSVGEKYFHLTSGAGRAWVENTEYGQENKGRPRVLLAKKPEGWRAPEKRTPRPLPAALREKMEATNRELAGTGFELRPTDWTSGIGLWQIAEDDMFGWDTTKTILADEGWFEGQVARAREEHVGEDAETGTIDAAAHEAATSPQNDLPAPTEAQREVENFKMGHPKIGGLDLTVQYPAGSERVGKDAQGEEWRRPMTVHYGHIVGVPARSPDKEHVDFYMKPETPEDFAGNVFIVNQTKDDGSFDEPKPMIGFDSREEAEQTYLSHMPENWTRYSGIATVPFERFRLMLQDPKAFLTAQPGVKSGDANRQKTGTTRAPEAAGVRNLADDEAALSQSAQPAVSVLRGEGDQRVPAVAGELRNVPAGRGAETVAGDDPGPAGQRPELRAGQRAVGAAGSAEGQPEQRDTVSVSGRSAPAEGVVGEEGHPAPNTQGAGEGVPLADRSSAGDSGKKSGSDVLAEGARIADVGENLWYNRRNFTRGAVTWDDIRGLNDALKVKEVVKGKVWPKPDYEKLVAEGLQPIFARLVKQVYDGIATAPAGRSDADLQRYISVVGRIRDAVFEWARDNNANRDFLNAIAERAQRMMGRRVSLIDMAGADRSFQTVILDRVWPGTVGNRNRFDSGEPRADITAIGGRRALKALQLTLDDTVAAMKDLDKGWPKSQEAWQRQGYGIAPSSGAVINEGARYPREGGREVIWSVSTRDGWKGSTISSHGTRDEAQSAKAALKPFLLLNKRGRLMSQHDTEGAAQEAAREITKREARGGDIRGMNISEAVRRGPDRRRPDENVSADRLMEEFGFRGVNFGREGWINQAERQAYLNHAYDALLDMAEILDVPPKALSMNGMLGIAFGAQGRGGRNAAHFVPGVNEINLTKTKGAGTLAHEWGHALDHYFATQSGLAKSTDPWMSSSGGRTGGDIRPEIAAAFKSVVEVMEKRPMKEEEVRASEEMSKNRAARDLESWLQLFRKDIERVAADKLPDYDRLAERMRRGDRGSGYVKVGQQTLSGVVGKVKELVKSIKGASTNAASNWKGLEATASFVAYKLEQKNAAKAHIPQTTSTVYAGESSRMDRDKGGEPYWRTKWEMFARAFETWVSGQLADRAQENTFLSDAVRRAAMRDPSGKGYAMPYPRGDDRQRINDAIGKLVDEIETRATDRGNVAMFSRQADNIEDYKLQKKQGRIEPLYWNAHIGLGRPSLAHGLDDGARIVTYQIYDAKAREQNGEPVNVGELNVVLDRNDKFTVLRNIQIRGPFRQKGLGWGENVVASVLAHNGHSIAMKVENIQHHREDKEWDALGFWRKMGVNLHNYSTNPDTQIDGTLTLGRYLRARAGRGNLLGDAAGPDQTAGEGAGRDVAEGTRGVEPATRRGPQAPGQPDAGAEGRGPGRRRGVLPREPGLPEAVADVRRQAGAISKLWGNAPNFAVTATPAEWPFDAPADAKGAYWRGAVYLAADNLVDPLDIKFTVFHETLGHYGLRRTFGKQLDAVLRDLAVKNVNLRRAAAKWMEANPKPEDWTAVDYRMQAIEEALSDVAGSGRTLSGIGRLFDLIQKWLRRHGFDEVANWLEGLTDAEALSVLAEARSFVQVEGMPTAGERGALPAMSRGAIEPRRRARREGLLNIATRVPMQLLGIDKLTSKAYDVLLEKVGGLVPENVKAGVVSDFGLPEAVIDRRALMQAHMRTQLRDVGGDLGKLFNLTRAESRVAYAWMNNRDGAELLADLPADSQEVLRGVKEKIDALSREAVRLGQLNADTYEQNRMAYLHRSYRKHELEATKQERASSARTVRILGDQYKGRGMVDAVEMGKIQNTAPEWWRRKLRAGRADAALVKEKFIRFERRWNRGEGVGTLEGVEPSEQLGKLREVVYWPAGEAVPEKFGAWRREGEWQVRTVDKGRAVMWRDFTPEERQRMGEIDEVRFAVAKTMQQMIHDTEAGKYLEWLANHYARDDENLPQSANVVAANESLFRAFAREDWVKVPEAEIPGTRVKKYGKLAGLYIPGPIWNDARQITNRRYSPLGEGFATALRAWKISKTALSPTVHMNNIMANVVIADWHDIQATDVARALAVIVNSGKPENKALLEAFEDSGGTQGMYALTELQREQLRPLVEQLQREVSDAEHSGMINAASVVQAMLAGRMRDAASAAAGGAVARGIGKAADRMIALYQTEDTVFRVAAFIKAKEEGKSNIEAGKAARKSFLDYQINAPWIQMLRSTALPFVSFAYRAAPMMLETYARKPWKLLKLWIVLGALNALGYALSGGDEDDERKLLPREKSGRILGILPPKLIRMPWNDRHGSPVFLDIRRFVPVGDLFDIGQVHSAVPWLPIAIPGGPLALAMELLNNKSQFTGRPITRESDTPREVATKVADHIYKNLAPNMQILPGTYAYTAIRNAGAGKTDPFGREQSVPMAVASSFGVKLAAYPRDVARRGIKFDLDSINRDVGAEIGKLRRELATKGISREEFDKKLRYQLDKKKKAVEEARERLR